MNKEGKQKLIIIIGIIFLIILFIPFVNSINLWDWVRDLGEITGMASSATHTVTLGITGGAPNVSNVSIATTSQSITEGGYTTLIFSFTANDPDGLTNLDNSTAEGTINKTIGGESVTRSNTSCTAKENLGTSATNFTCEIPIWYWEMNGTWNINASICDENNLCTQNFTRTFTLGATGSIQISPPAINFGSLTKGTSNNSATDDPITINNTGNLNVSAGNVKITTIDLAGADTTTIAAENFTVGIATGSFSECDVSATANKTINNTAIPITMAGLARGNLTNVEPVNTTFQEQLYFCFYKPVPNWLPPQTYDTTAGGPWTISIV